MGHQLYNILGLSKDSSPEDIKKAYRKMAIEHHPDKGGDADKFKEISNAYSILSDPEKKQKYDQFGDEGYENGAEGINPNDIFEHLFGRGGGGIFRQQQEQRKCRNAQHIIQLTNKEAYFGGNKSLKITIHKKCMSCIDMCQTCQGQGVINEIQRMGPFTNMFSRTCHMCSGSGQQIKRGNKGCSSCAGNSEIIEERKLDLVIPMGVETGFQIVFKGLGEQPQQPNDIAGDLIFEFLVVLDMFERNGLDLTYKVSLTFLESLIGKDIEIPLYDGEYKMNTSVFGIIEPNKQYVLKGKGMKTDKKEGNLILIFKVNYPNKTGFSQEYKKEITELLKKYDIN